jgi:hypothetical protein
MSDASDPKTNTTSEEPEEGRRPYVKPIITWVERLDSPSVLAMACARAVVQDAQCAAGGLAS